MENDLRKKEFAEKYRMLIHEHEVRMRLCLSNSAVVVLWMSIQQSM